MKKQLTQYFVNLYKGRIGRGTFFWGSLFLDLVLGTIGNILSLGDNLSNEMALGGIATLLVILFTAFALCNASLWIRRLHDLEHSGFYVLLLFIPIVNIFILANALFQKGKPGSNRFGSRVIGASFIRDMFAFYQK